MYCAVAWFVVEADELEFVASIVDIGTGGSGVSYLVGSTKATGDSACPRDGSLSRTPLIPSLP